MSELLHEKTISELAPLIKSKQVSPKEITLAVLEQIEKLDSQLNAFIEVTAKKALEQAVVAETRSVEWKLSWTTAWYSDGY